MVNAQSPLLGFAPLQTCRYISRAAVTSRTTSSWSSCKLSMLRQCLVTLSKMRTTQKQQIYDIGPSLCHRRVMADCSMTQSNAAVQTTLPQHGYRLIAVVILTPSNSQYDQASGCSVMHTIVEIQVTNRPDTADKADKVGE